MKTIRSRGAVQAARYELQQWGNWWRWRQYAECDQAGVSPGQLLLEVCRLGTRVQTTNTRAHLQRGDAIHVPLWVAVMDSIVEELDLRGRQSIMAWYVRSQPVGKRGPTLMRAELAVADAILADCPHALAPAA